MDLGRWWKEETGLPLPLGGNVVRRDLGAETIGRISRALSRSIEYGLAHREAALSHAMRYARGLDRAQGRPVRRDVRQRLDAGLRRGRAPGGADAPRPGRMRPASSRR